MYITCPHCLQKAKITSRNNLNAEKTVADLYCSCTNIRECGATFVTSIGFKHWLNPPNKSTAQLAMNLLSRLNQLEKAALLEGIRSL